MEYHGCQYDVIPRQFYPIVEIFRTIGTMLICQSAPRPSYYGMSECPIYIYMPSCRKMDPNSNWMTEILHSQIYTTSVNNFFWTDEFRQTGISSSTGSRITYYSTSSSRSIFLIKNHKKRLCCAALVRLCPLVRAVRVRAVSG